MLRFKVYFSFIFFSCLLLFAASYKSNEVKNNIKGNTAKLTEQSFFYKPTFFSIRAKNYLKINSSELLAQNNGDELIFIKPKGLIISSNTIHFSGDTGTYGQKNDHFHLKKNARVIMKKSKINANQIDFYANKNLIVAKTNVRFSSKEVGLDGNLFINSNFLKSYIHTEKITLSGKVHGKLTRFRKYQEGLEFFADKFNFNGVSGQGQLEKNVRLKRSNWSATAQNGMVFLKSHSKKLKYYQLNDDVRLTEEVFDIDPKKRFVRKAFSERLIGYVLDQKIVLFGEPKIYQKGDLIKGTKITLREDQQLIEVDNSNSNFKMRN